MAQGCLKSCPGVRARRYHQVLWAERDILSHSLQQGIAAGVPSQVEKQDSALSSVQTSQSVPAHLSACTRSAVSCSLGPLPASFQHLTACAASCVHCHSLLGKRFPFLGSHKSGSSFFVSGSSQRGQSFLNQC
jgi:hypothetical protein